MTRASLSNQRIVETAEQLIRETGPADWTVRALCKELECAPGAIYRYFPGGVDAIGAEIRARQFAVLADQLDRVEADPEAEGLPSLDPRSQGARMARRCRGYLAFAEARPEIYRSLFAARALQAGEAPGAGAMVERPASLIQAAAQARELARPSIGRGDAFRMALMVWTRLHGFADLALSGLVPAIDEALADQLLIDILAQVGYRVAAYPAGLEAAARAARAARQR